MKKILISLFAILLASPIVYSADNSRITLSDGTTIYGKVVGMSDGVYKIQTETMGEISVNSDNVIEISKNTSNNNQKNIGILDGNNNRKSNTTYNNTQRNNSNNYSAQQQDADAKVQSMMMNQGFINNLMDLNESSAMQSVLNDPEVMEAIQSGDYEFLMNNPKMNELMNSSEIQDILGGM